MKPIPNASALAALLALALAACGGGSSGRPSGVAFVQGQIARTSDTTDPVPINDLELAFPEDTAQFDALFR